MAGDMAGLSRRTPRRIAISGAGGNLGRKLMPALAEIDSVKAIIALDRQPPGDAAGFAKADWREADLTQPLDAWRHHLHGVDTIIHLAATNPHPDSGWNHAFASFEITARLTQLSLSEGVERLVFASSNHAMGGYFDADGPQVETGWLKGTTPSRPGTKWVGGGEAHNSTIYGASKGFGEHLLRVAAEAGGGKLSTIAVRIGWVQPGENRYETIGSEGVSTEKPSDPDENTTPAGRWFRGMWLSNRDLVQLGKLCVEVSADNWPGPHIVVNGVSDNADSPWSFEDAANLLGYRPQN